MTIAEKLRPVDRVHALAYDVFLVVGGSLLIALSARVVVPIPFSPVPVTGQTFAVLFLGALLGRIRGLSTALAYIAEGAFGLPVFAGGVGGAAYLFGTTGGYLLGFAAAAYVVGLLAERGWGARHTKVASAMVIGNAVIYLLGAAWLSRFVGATNAVALGVVPFLVGDALKVALATVLLPLFTSDASE